MLILEGSANCPVKVSTHVFAPEAHWKSAGGVTTGTKPVEPPSPGGATDRSRSVAPPGLESMGSQSRWFHHRLISGVPPGRRVIPDLCRNFKLSSLRDCFSRHLIANRDSAFI